MIEYTTATAPPLAIPTYLQKLGFPPRRDFRLKTGFADRKVDQTSKS